jgi:TRAP-type transport system periplasmic protein
MKMSFQTRSIVAIAAAATMMTTAAQAETTLRFAHWNQESHPLVRTGFTEWMKSITEASGGAITFEVYPAQQLGAAKDHYDMARDGIADVTWVNPGYQPGRFPIISAAELPLTFSNADEGTKALSDWYAPYAEAEMSEVKFCLAHVNQPSTVHSKVELRAPSQLSGMKIRPSNAIIASYFRGAGAVNVTVAAPETRDALEKGTADAITFPVGQLVPYGLAELVTYHVDIPLYTQSAVLVMNRATYDSMPPEEKAVIDAHCTGDWAARLVKGWNIYEREAKAELEANAEHTFVAPTPEEMEQWRALVPTALDGWKADVASKGGDPEAVWSSFTAALDAVDSRLK